MSADETSTYYQTERWQIKIDQTLHSFEVPQQLQQPTQHRKNPQCKDNISHLIPYAMPLPQPASHFQNGLWIFYYLILSIAIFTVHSFIHKKWFKCMYIHCFIAVKICEFFNKCTLSLSQHMSLVLKWKSLFINCISLGNHIYDSVTPGIGKYFSVQEAASFLTPITGNVQLEDSFDLSILSENPMVPQSSLAFFFGTARQRRQSCCCCNHEWHDHQPGWTKQQHNSHGQPLTVHGQLGAMVGIISVIN